jgi:hypothetical protein
MPDLPTGCVHPIQVSLTTEQQTSKERVAVVDATAGLLRDAPDWPEWLASVRAGTADERTPELDE